MPDPVDLAFAFRLPPEQAIAYFASKGFVISWNWFDVLQEMQARAFTVAKATQSNVLSTIHAEMSKALAEGITEREFERRLEPKLRSLGWWGKQEITNDAGAVVDVQLGSPHRLKTIFRNNMNTALSAGRFKQQREMAAERPFWQYITMNDGRVRASHGALHGLVFAADDPIWDSIYPPNGFGCRCRVRTLSQFRLEREGLQVQSSEGKLEKRTVELGTDQQTGEVVNVETTVFRGEDIFGRSITFNPDPGWDVNHGASSLWDALGNQPNADGVAPEFAAGKPRLQPLPGQPTWKDSGLPSIRQAGEVLPATEPLPDADQFTQQQLAEAIGITDDQQIASPIGQQLVTPEMLQHMNAVPDAIYATRIRQAITQPVEIWQTDYADGPRLHFLAGFEDVGINLRINHDGSLVWSAHDDDGQMNAARAGLLIWSQDDV